MSLVQEQEKYERAWRLKDYRDIAPGEEDIPQFKAMVMSRYIKDLRCTLTDFGCGTGRGARELSKLGYDVILMLDIADNCLDKDVAEKLGDVFMQGDLRIDNKDWPKADYGYCTDVMEHIAPEYVMLVLTNILKHCRECFFNICNIPDNFGAMLQTELHLTVKPYLWWKERLEEICEVVDARDLMTSSAFHVRSTL